MVRDSVEQPQVSQGDPDALVRLGGWLFRWRTSLPVPIAAILILWPAGQISRPLAIAGFVLVAGGEALRLWGVRQIGVISRTRSDRLGPLVSTGPFAFVRNPLYLGNISLWGGFALAAGPQWMAPAVVAALAFIYHAIVRWEEGLLERRLGSHYSDYAARVPRWLPRFSRTGSSTEAVASSTFGAFSWRDTLFSERGTLMAIAIGVLLVWAKNRL